MVKAIYKNKEITIQNQDEIPNLAEKRVGIYVTFQANPPARTGCKSFDRAQSYIMDRVASAINRTAAGYEVYPVNIVEASFASGADGKVLVEKLLFQLKLR